MFYHIVSYHIIPYLITASLVRLKGYARNDIEAAKYLHWKTPIYYDSDFLLGIPPDAGTATIVTQNILNLPEHLRANVRV